MTTPIRKLGIECLIPILNARDLAASRRFYIDLLGFQLDWEAPGMISVSQDRHAIMLCEGAQGHSGTWVWIGVNDIQPLYDELLARGAKFHEPPTNYSWAYEFKLLDPDGHVLRFGSDPLSDRPIV